MDLRREAELGEALAAFAADPHVEYVQPNYGVERDRILDDPFLASNGSWGQSFADLWGIERIGAPAAWDHTLGEDSVIAIVDTGLDLRHPDIVENLFVHPGEDLDGDGIADPEERNGIDDDGNGFIDDLHGFDFFDAIDANEDGDFDDPGDVVGDPDPTDLTGHGTHVAGTAAGRGDNGIGIAGVAPRARVMAIKIFPDGGGPGDTAKSWRGVLYAAENGADVINASWSCSPRCPSNPIGEEVARLVHELGVVFVTSAGNRSDDAVATSPERLPETLTVSAGMPDDSLARFSSFGFIVDVVAPGDAILSLLIEDESLWSPRRFVGDDYMFLEGTSMASPHVAGVVALMLSADPTLTPDEVRARIRRTAEDAGDPGVDRTFSHGWVRPDRALADTSRPDARARFDPKLIGGRPEQEDGRIRVEGTIDGADVERARLSFGQGADPAVWEELAVFGPGAFVHGWDVTALPEGPHVLRLVVELRNGELFMEYAPLSLDRIPPFFISPLGRPALQPDVAGDRVVWSRRRNAEDGSPADFDLERGNFGVEGGETIFEGIGDQVSPVLSTRALVWSDLPPDPQLNDRLGLAGCAQRGHFAPCNPIAVATDPRRIRSVPSLAGRDLVYAEQTGSGHQLLLCRLGVKPCKSRAIAPLLSRPPEPKFDGRRVVFTDRDGDELRIFVCEVSRDGLCVPRATEISHPVHLSPKAYADGLVVYEDIDVFPTFVYRLFVCKLDPMSGACPPMHVQTSPGSFQMDFSQGRIAWRTFAPNFTEDLAFCRFDPSRGVCPAQALTRDPNRQHRVKIDGHRVVWEDDRDGAVRVASLALPTLAPIPPRRVRAGSMLSLELRETTGQTGVSFEGTTDAGDPVESVGVRLREMRPGRVHVRWRPGSADVGTHRFRFRASLQNGLYDERTLEIEVLPRGGTR
jgi:subtilisin family serine protease